MKITETQLKKIIKEIVQVPKPHKVEEEVTEEMLEDMISVLPLWEIGEFDQVEALIQDLHPMGRTQLHNLMNAAEEMKNYGQINDNVPEFATDYFHKKFVDEWEEIQEMKITRRQLRRIIKEALDPNADQQEAAYAVAYTSGYLATSDADFGEILRKNKNLSYQVGAWQPLDDALGNIHSVMVSGLSSIKRENPKLQLPEEDSIFQEGQAAGQADFRESAYKYIEQVDILVTRQTPMGMSAAAGLGVFGIEGGGVLFKDTAISDARALIALMDNDDVLGWLDRLESDGIK